MNILILNKVWKLRDLQTNSRKEKVKNLVNQYNKESNCRPYDFIANEKISEIEKASFIYSTINN